MYWWQRLRCRNILKTRKNLFTALLWSVADRKQNIKQTINKVKKDKPSGKVITVKQRLKETRDRYPETLSVREAGGASGGSGR